ncbi:hypothetical protein Hanom_Chr07g00617691 [Helianthus anomalus]
MCISGDCFVTDTISSSESGLSDTDDPMAIVSDDEIVPEPYIFTSNTESDPEMMSDDDEDFQPFALLDFGIDLPIADGISDEDTFVISVPVHDHLIIGHPDGEHVVEMENSMRTLSMFHFWGSCY